MENASEALFMAFAVLVFVVALSIGISSFSLARQTTQAIVDRTDRDFDYKYISSTLNSEGKAMEIRTVGVETIVPALYRAYKENYIVRFYKEENGTTNPLNIYKRKVNGKMVETNEINLEKESIANQEKATLFIDKVLYGGLKNVTSFNNNFENLQVNGFYDIIKKTKFKEELGVYYIEDVNNGENNSNDDEISEVNKTEKRVITYITKAEWYK